MLWVLYVNTMVSNKWQSNLLTRSLKWLNENEFNTYYILLNMFHIISITHKQYNATKHPSEKVRYQAGKNDYSVV